MDCGGAPAYILHKRQHRGRAGAGRMLGIAKVAQRWGRRQAKPARFQIGFDGRCFRRHGIIPKRQRSGAAIGRGIARARRARGYWFRLT